MKKRILCKALCVIVIVYQVFLCAGCFYQSEEKVIGTTMLSFAIPGGYFNSPHGHQVKLLEQDSFGRQVYAVQAPNYYQLSAICVVQMVDDKYIYYYDNISYFCTKKYKEYSEEALLRLKDSNDWERPLNRDKMIARIKNDRLDNSAVIDSSVLLDAAYVEEILRSYVDCGSEDYLYILVCDKNEYDQELYVASILDLSKEASDPDRIQRTWFAVFEGSGDYNPETFLREIDDIYSSNQDLERIKALNHWYGCTDSFGFSAFGWEDRICSVNALRKETSFRKMF